MNINRLYSSPNDVPRVELVAPIELCIYSDEAQMETIQFLNLISITVFTNNSYVLLDFSNTRKITAAACLILFAHVTRCQACSSKEFFQFHDQIIQLILPIDKECRQLFVSCRLWDSIKAGGIRKIDGSWDDKDQPFKTGKSPETQSLNSLNWIKSKVDAVPRKLHGAVQEAFLNIKHHAYNKENLASFMDDRWWQYSYIRDIDGEPSRLIFIIYDMGVGIPEKSTGWLKSDSASIVTAMKKGWSSTDIKGRGQGSEDLKKPTLVRINDDFLTIRSNKGEVTYKNGNMLNSKNHQYSIYGTLIEWSLSIEDN